MAAARALPSQVEKSAANSLPQNLLAIARKIVELHPDQKAIIASGFSETERVKEAQRLGAGAFIKKPYTLNNIGKAIRHELDKSRA